MLLDHPEMGEAQEAQRRFLQPLDGIAQEDGRRAEASDEVIISPEDDRALHEANPWVSKG